MGEIEEVISYPVYDPKKPNADMIDYYYSADNFDDDALPPECLRMLYALSKNAYSNSVCNKCIKCEVCQNMELSIVYRLCPMHSLVTSRPFAMSEEVANKFGEDMLQLLRALHAKEGIINGYIFDDMQNCMILASAKWLGIPKRSKTNGRR